MTSKLAATVTAAGIALGSLFIPGAATAQTLFEPVIRVNDQAITRFEIAQRARMMTLFRAPGDPQALAREQLIDDRLKLDAARARGLVLEEADIRTGMEEFASRADLGIEQFLRQLDGAGVAEATFRDFVRAGITWRELTRGLFAQQISVSEDDIERARIALSSGGGGVRVLLSEIILPANPGNMEQVQARATRISDLKGQAAFAAQARQHSAAASAQRGGRMPWMQIADLPPQLRQIILGLAPGDVSNPLPIDGAIALFLMRDIREAPPPAPTYAAIEYATYAIPGGRSAAALAEAAQIRTRIDTCDDLYGEALDQPEGVLQRSSRAPDDIPQDIAMELARLDAGETSVNVTRNNGETLMLLMLCGRTPTFGDQDGPSTEQLTNLIRNQRMDSFSQGFLEQLRAEARIIRK